MGNPKSVQRAPARLPGPPRPAAGSGGGSVHVVGAGGIVFVKGVEHHHAPSGRWAEVQKRSWSSDVDIATACSLFDDPSYLVIAAILAEFKTKPIAFKHLDWYLSTGGGAIFNEDDNVKILLEQDEHIQGIFRALLKGKSGRFVGHRKIQQSDYSTSLTGQDLRFAFGGIDRFDFIADFKAGTFQGWFMDFYEWHPFYPGIYSVKPGDIARGDNCVHAALVELKSGSARDFWMQGQATVDLAKIMTPPSPSIWPF